MNSPFPLPTASIELDVRPIPCREKHALIFRQWDQLAVGAAFVLINDHDPVPLYYQFAALFPEAFDWTYLCEGPFEFQVRVTRLRATAPTPATLPRPGGCHGGRSSAAGSGRSPPADELDVRGLEPPLPMTKILEQAEHLAPGEALHARTDRHPLHLLAELGQRGFDHHSEELSDGSWRTLVQRR